MKRIFPCILSVVLLLTMGACSKADKKVSANIKSAFTEDTLKIKMEDYTDFDWDTLIVYRHPADAAEIDEAGGIRYRGSLDLTDGMIFAKDGRVVYEEVFPTDFETPYAFVVFPCAEEDPDQAHVRAFTPKTAVFAGTRENYDGKYDRYTFYPAAVD